MDNTDYEATNPVEADDTISHEGVAEEAQALGDDVDQTDPDSSNPQEGDEESTPDEAEIEVDGQKYRVPKALEGAFLKNADYTKKTQEVAEHRRAIEAERVALATAAEAQKEFLAEHVKVTQLQQTVDYYANVDWQLALERDPDIAQQERWRYDEAREQLAAAKASLQTKENERLEAQRAKNAQAFQEAGRVLARDIPGWNQDLALKLVETAATYGVSHEELAGEADPRVWKLIHAAHQWNQHQTKQANSERAKQAATTAPIKTVGGKGSPPDRVAKVSNMDDWMKARNAQVRKGR